MLGSANISTPEALLYQLSLKLKGATLSNQKHRGLQFTFSPGAPVSPFSPFRPSKPWENLKTEKIIEDLCAIPNGSLPLNFVTGVDYI